VELGDFQQQCKLAKHGCYHGGPADPQFLSFQANFTNDGVNRLSGDSLQPAPAERYHLLHFVHLRFAEPSDPGANFGYFSHEDDLFRK
jgi:hypothetical protein